MSGVKNVVYISFKQNKLLIKLLKIIGIQNSRESVSYGNRLNHIRYKVRILILELVYRLLFQKITELFPITTLHVKIRWNKLFLNLIIEKTLSKYLQELRKNF